MGPVGPVGPVTPVGPVGTTPPDIKDTSSTTTLAVPGSPCLLIDTIAIVVPGGAGTAVPVKSCQLPRDASGRVFGGILITNPSPRKLKDALKYEIVIVVSGLGKAPIFPRYAEKLLLLLKSPCTI